MLPQPSTGIWSVFICMTLSCIRWFRAIPSVSEESESDGGNHHRDYRESGGLDPGNSTLLVSRSVRRSAVNPALNQACSGGSKTAICRRSSRRAR